MDYGESKYGIKVVGCILDLALDLNVDLSFAGWVTRIACDDDRVILGYLAGVQYPAYFAWYAICVMCCLVIQQCEYIVTFG